MAAGQGFKTFANGDILTAADVNGYLMQGVLVFATTAARDAAITSPQQGQVALTKDTNTIWKYTGSTWTNIDTGAADPLTTKGDIWGYSTTDARIPVGTNGQVLTADSTQSVGVKWATPSSGSFTSIATGSLSGASITINSIPSTYKQLALIVENYKPATDSTRLWLRLNGNSTNYYTASTASTLASNVAFDTAQAELTLGQSNAAANGIVVANLPNYALSEWKIITVTGITNNITTTTNLNWRLTNTVIGKDTNAVTSMTILPETGNFTSGTYTLYGVS